MLFRSATTKYLCGGGSTVGGAVIDTGNYDWKDNKRVDLSDLSMFGNLAFLAKSRKIRSNTGAALSPQNAYLSSLGLDTLTIRMDKHCENALSLTSYLEQHNKVEAVAYPGLKSSPDYELANKQFGGKFSGMLTLRLGSKEKAFYCINHLKIAKNLVNLGDAKTLVVHPKSTIYRDFTDQEADDAGVYDDLIRVSVGLENSEDLKQDFDQALAGL